MTARLRLGIAVVYPDLRWVSSCKARCCPGGPYRLLLSPAGEYIGASVHSGAHRMTANYVIDTNVLLHDPNAILGYKDNCVIIPISVIEEVDKFKREGNELGRNARKISRQLDELRARHGSLLDGVPLESGGRLRIAIPEKHLDRKHALDDTKADARILQTAIEAKDSGRRTVLVSMDTNLRIRADIAGIDAESYDNKRVQIDQLDPGFAEIELSDTDFADFEASRKKKLAVPLDAKLNPNMGVYLRCPSQEKAALGRVNASGKFIVPLKPHGDVMGIQAKNREQEFAFELLLDDRISLVTLAGKAGTGKTLLALAAALKRTVEDGFYTRVLVTRPIIPLGRDLGFLPGSVDEKMNPWLQPIFDNLEQLSATSSGKKGLNIKKLIEDGLVQVEPLTYIRGRSLPQQFLIVDEAQNLTPHEVKTIITRSGRGTKVVLTGDPYQIDNPYVDSASNGLTIVTDRFKQEPIAGHIVLSQGERSELAELASNLL